MILDCHPAYLPAPLQPHRIQNPLPILLLQLQGDLVGAIYFTLGYSHIQLSKGILQLSDLGQVVVAESGQGLHALLCLSPPCQLPLASLQPP